MLYELLRYWWAYLVRGILALLFGLFCLLAPGITLAMLTVWAGAFVLVDGVFGLVGTLSNWKQLEEKWMLLLEAVVSILLGWLIMRMPEVTVLWLVFMMALWAMIAGFTRIAIAIRLRKEIKGEGWMILSGVLTIGLGVVLVMLPGIGVVYLAMLLGIGALVLGGALIAASLRMRKLHRAMKDKSENR